jgi:chromosome segregation ATPase
MKYPRIAWVVLSGMLAAGTLHAEEKSGAREREALRRVQAQLQSVQQAQTALQDKLRTTDEEKAALEQRVKDVQSRANADSQKSRQLQTALDAAQEEHKTTLAAKAELERQLKAAQDRVAVLEKDLAQTGAQLKASEGALQNRNRQVNACEKRNTELYGLGRKLVAQCTDAGSANLSDLPDQLSGARRVQFESAMEAYRDQLDAERLLPGERAQ